MGWVTEVATVEAEPQQHTVLISAGHSSTDPGAVAQGHTEAEIVTEFRDLVSQALADQGIRHLTDGPAGRNWPLGEAVELAAEADIAVEFHCDAASPRASGTWTLSHASDFPLAGRLCTVTAETLGIRNRGAAPENAGQHHRLAFVSDGGGIIHELYFLTSPVDLAAYQQHRAALAERVAGVIAEAARRA
ncbi:N-acetylmuramoyl-L-alanine amidase [Halomonas cerina]|uniref:N-acetylmuramoyl-L-alanine amidase n=1 Tax=Halomonas cerina TaxID=447424 RepID=A0A839VHH0_9GAMM|nr:N-acetylmuramoyl-L-alanine amidase [Halomonas cerina]MBB3192064.1 N-acetylmuramoyl-L-alanine amidase [Halomonas cerina]